MKAIVGFVGRLCAALVGLVVGAVLGLALALATGSDAYLWLIGGGAGLGGALCLSKPGLAWLPFEIVSDA